MAAPNSTLFVQNLNDKIKKNELRLSLYALFSPYGKVLDVVATRAQNMRGTAHVVFRDLAASTSALRGLDGERVYGKQIKLSYSKSVSHATVRQTSGEEAFYAAKMGRDTTAKKTKLTVSSAQQTVEDEARKRDRENRQAEEGNESEDMDEDDDEDEDADGPPEPKKRRTNGDDEW